MRHFTTTLVTALLLALPAFVQAEVPKMINFQGILKNGSGSPVADGAYTVSFRIYDASAGGNVLWQETKSVSTSGGLFAVLLGTVNPVPDSAFNDTGIYLGITVGADPEMTPREELVSVPYAIRVGSVEGALGGTILTKVSIGPGHSNTGTQAFIAGANNTASGDTSTASGGARNVASGLISTISGGAGNTASGAGSTVGGGGSNVAAGISSTIGGGAVNYTGNNDAVVAGGYLDSAIGLRSVVGGGEHNVSNNGWATVAGGGINIASGVGAAVGGGTVNTAGGHRSTVSGGRFNQASGDYAVVGGGYGDTASAQSATVGGGGNNRAAGISSTVGGGAGNYAGNNDATVAGGYLDSALGYRSTVGGGEHNVTSNAWSTVGGGATNAASEQFATVGGGNGNQASQLAATVGGGNVNSATHQYATVGGGTRNNASGFLSAVGGGGFDTASGYAATVAGGYANRASGDFSFAAGVNAKARHAGAFVWSDTSIGGFASTRPGQFLIRASGGVGIANDSPLALVQIKTTNDSLDAGFINTWDSRHVVIGGPGRVGGIGLSYDYTNQQGYIEALSPNAFWRNLILQNGGGRVGIGTGTTVPAATLHVNGTAGNTTGIWSMLSDRRLKLDIQPLHHALETVHRLQPVTFRWKDSQKDAEFGRVRGLIAQDVEKVIPEWIKTDPDGYKRIEPIGVDALLIEAIKELDTKVEKVEELENRIGKLERLVETLTAENHGGSTSDVAIRP